MSDAPERASDARMQDSFSAIVLFNSPFQFRMSDIFAAAEKEFPDLIRADTQSPFSLVDTLHDTAEKIPMASMALTAECSAPMVTISSLTGGRYPEMPETAIRAAVAFPGAQQAWDDHQSYLSISAGGSSDDLVDRFRAAQLTSAVAALFACDPSCVGVLFPTGDVITGPQEWQEGAKIAAEGHWPLDRWISFRMNGQKLGEKVYFGCQSMGMAAFNGSEVHFASAPVAPAEAANYAYGVCHMMFEGGSIFSDFDTMGVAGSDEKMGIRLLPEGPKTHTDTWVLLHPESPVDEKAAFGERSAELSPPSQNNSRTPEDGFFQSLLKEAIRKK